MGSMFPWSTLEHIGARKTCILIHRKFCSIHPASTGSFLPAGLQYQGRCRTQCWHKDGGFHGFSTSWSLSVGTPSEKQNSDPKKLRSSASSHYSLQLIFLHSLQIVWCQCLKCSMSSCWGGHSANKGVAATVAFKRGMWSLWAGSRTKSLQAPKWNLIPHVSS